MIGPGRFLLEDSEPVYLETWRRGGLPEKVEAVVLETPREETEEWVKKAADAGVRSVWIHMARETPEAVALARERGLEVLTGTCAEMYVKKGFSYHSLHKWINQALRRY